MSDERCPVCDLLVDSPWLWGAHEAQDHLAGDGFDGWDFPAKVVPAERRREILERLQRSVSSGEDHEREEYTNDPEEQRTAKELPCDICGSVAGEKDYTWEYQESGLCFECGVVHELMVSHGKDGENFDLAGHLEKKQRVLDIRSGMSLLDTELTALQDAFDCDVPDAEYMSPEEIVSGLKRVRQSTLEIVEKIDQLVLRASSLSGGGYAKPPERITRFLEKSLVVDKTP